MEILIEFLLYILKEYGMAALLTFAGVASLPLALVSYIIFAVSSSGKAIDKKLAKKLEQDKTAHKIGNCIRKQFSQNVKNILQELAQDTESDRALVFEYSNGTRNLVGLPFLYTSAVAEVNVPELNPISHRFQKINLSLLSGFIHKLEEEGSIYIEDIEEIKQEYPILHELLKPSLAKSALFYALQGIDEVIGFIVITKVDKAIIKKPSLTEVAKSAQLISSMINFEEYQKELDLNNK